MTTKGLAIRAAIYACCLIAGFLIVAPMFTGSPRPTKNFTTQVTMRDMSCFFAGAMVTGGHSNIVETVNRIESKQDIPRIIEYKTISHIIESYSGVETVTLKFYKDGKLIDAWGQPITIMLMPNHIGEAGIVMHSSGKNRRNENGGGGRHRDVVQCGYVPVAGGSRGIQNPA